MDKNQQKEFVKSLVEAMNERYSLENIGQGVGEVTNFNITTTPIHIISDEILTAKISSAVANAIANKTVYQNGAVEYKWNMTAPANRGIIQLVDKSFDGIKIDKNTTLDDIKSIATEYFIPDSDFETYSDGINFTPSRTDDSDPHDGNWTINYFDFKNFSDEIEISFKSSVVSNGLLEVIILNKDTNERLFILEDAWDNDNEMDLYINGNKIFDKVSSIDETITFKTNGARNLRFLIGGYQNYNKNTFTLRSLQGKQFNKGKELVSYIDPRKPEDFATSIVDSTDPFGDGSLLSKYLFEDNVNDRTSINNMMVSGTLNYTDGKFGKSLLFNRSQSLYTSQNVTMEDISISVWFKSDGDLPTTQNWDADHMDIITFCNEGGTGEFSFIFRIVGDKLTTWFANVSGGTSDNIFSDIVVPNNEWTHLVTSFDKTNKKVTLYIDGQVAGVKENLDLSDFNPTNTRLHIAGRGDGKAYLKGNLDQVEVYTRPLTLAEVQILYSQSIGEAKEVPGLLVTKKSDTELNIIGGSKSIVDSVDPFGDSSLVAKYMFEDNVDDLLGNHNGSLVKGTAEFIEGIFGKSLKSGTYQIGTIDHKSFSIWVKLLEEPTGRVLFWENSGARFELLISSDRNKVYIGGRLNGSGNYIGKEVNLNNTLNLNEPIHIYFKYNGVNSKIYVNNTEYLFDVDLGSDIIGTLTINGRNDNDDINSFNGLIDQLEIYNRPLTEEEIQSLYTQTIKSSEIQNTLTVSNNIVDIAYTPDGGRLAVLTDANIVTYDLIDDQYQLQQTISDIGIKDCISMDFTGQTIIVSGSDGIDKYDLNNYGNWLKVNISTEPVVTSYITADGEELYIYNTKLQVASKPFTTFTDVSIDEPKEAKKIHLTLDKQVLYLGNPDDDTVATDNGVVHRYVKQNGISDDGHIFQSDTLEDIATNRGNNNLVDITDEKFQKAMYFQDDSDGVDVTAPTEVNSISFWIKSDGTGHGMMPLFVDNYNNETNGMFISVNSGEDSRWDIVKDGINNYDGAGGYIDDKFYHVVVTSDLTANKLNLYVDGLFIKSIDGIIYPIIEANGTVKVGYSYSDSYRFKGWVGDLRLFNRILTEDEIQALYNGSDIEKFIFQDSITSGNTEQQFGFGNSISTNFTGDRLFIASKQDVKEYKVGE